MNARGEITAKSVQRLRT